MTIARHSLRSGAPPDEVFYPESDGKPMAETPKHGNQMWYCITALNRYFANRPDVYAWGNMFIYYQEGDPRKHVSPDCFVVYGVDKREREIYQTWKERNRTPDVVFEITSRTTRNEDTRTKYHLYEQVLKVPEYFLFDPRADYLKPRLRGYRLVNGSYQPLFPVDNRLASEQLQLEIVEMGDLLRFYNPATSSFVASDEELAQRTEQEERCADREAQRAEQEAQHARRVEEENERLRAEIARLRGE